MRQLCTISSDRQLSDSHDCPKRFLVNLCRHSGEYDSWMMYATPVGTMAIVGKVKAVTTAVHTFLAIFVRALTTYIMILLQLHVVSQRTVDHSVCMC